MVAEELWTIGFLYTITILFCLPERIISQKLDFQDEEIDLCKGFDQLLANNSYVILPVQLSDQDKPCGVTFPRMEFDELLDCICNNNSSKQCVVSWNENSVGNVFFQRISPFLLSCENNIFVPFAGLVVACSDSSVISPSTIVRCENVPIPRFDWTCSSLPRTLHLGGDWILQVQQSGKGTEVTVCTYNSSITPTTPTTPTAALTTSTKTAAALTTTTTAVALTIVPTIRTSLTTTTTTVPTPYSTSVKNGNSRTNGLTSTSNTPGSKDSSESDISDDKLKIIIISIVTSIIALTAIILTVIIILRKRNKQQNMSSKDVEHNRDTKSSAQPESVGLNGTTKMAYLDHSPDFDSTSASYYNGPVYSPHLDSTSASYYNGPVHLPNLDHNPDFDGSSTFYYNTLT